MERKADSQHQEGEENIIQQTNEELNENIKALSDSLFALARGLPEWNLLPPETLIKRRKS